MGTAYKNVEMYCFSGTGNSLRASQWIAERAEAAGASARIHRIEAGRQVELPAADGKLLLGFLYSTHGFCAPWSVLKLLARTPRRAGREVDVFLLNTRGGVKAGPLFIPGLSGVALILPLLMLLWKGYRVLGMRPLDMPVSWLQIHPGLGEKIVNPIVARRQAQTLAFADKLLAGERAWHGWWTLPIDLAIASITPMYLAIGRFGLAKLQISSRACDGCGVCAQMCPTRAIEMRGKRPYWTFDCESCMRCYSVCPKKAVQCSHPYLALMIAAMVFGAAPAELASQWLKENSSPVVGTLAYYLLAYAGSMLSLFVSYVALYWLMKVRPVGLVLSYGSFNQYWKRYLAPGIKVKDFRTPKAAQPGTAEAPPPA